MKCFGHWELDLEIDGIIVPLCARYGGMGTEVLRNCFWCPWVDDTEEYGKDPLCEGIEWK